MANQMRQPGPGPNIGLQRTGACAPAAEAGSLGSQRMRPLLVTVALLSLTACASRGNLFVSVRDVDGGPIPGVAITAGTVQAKSDSHGTASFWNVKRGSYEIDGSVPGMKSCGPLHVEVRGATPAETTLYFRLATIADGFETFTGPDGITQSRSASWLEYGPCPGRPETAIKVKTCCDSSSQKPSEAP